MLKLAIEARVPFISVKTDDLLFAADVLTFIAGVETAPFPAELPEDLSDFQLPAEDVLYTSRNIECPELYFLLENNKKSLVFINAPRPSALFFTGGQLLPPKEMTYGVLVEIFGKTKTGKAKAEEVLTAFGGLTLKDVRELIQLTTEEFGEVTAKGVNIVRQGYISKLKGMVQVDTTLDHYDCPNYLSKWLDKNLYFFEHDVHMNLRPRGLLFDGPPGTGKTAASKAIANALGMPLFRMDIGGMKGKYVGDSEGNLQAALQTVDQMAPCVVILDEIEKMFGETHDSGVTSSMLGTLLWWLQEHESKVMTIMTTNKKASIPPELYREGRIDSVMDFQGLEGLQAASLFATNAMDALLKKVAIPDTTGLMAPVLAKLKTATFPVAQAKVVTMVQSALKDKFLEGVEK